MRILIVSLLMFFGTLHAVSQTPPIEPGVSQDLAKWRAAHYSNVRYKLNITLEKMSPVLKGSIEIRVNVGTRTLLSASPQSGEIPPIILDWRKLSGHEKDSTISNVTLNGTVAANVSPQGGDADRSVRVLYEERDEHLIFRDGVVPGENVIKLDFTSPILTSGSAITRYIDKEDGAEYIYSLFVPSDASTAFPVFDQPDLKARFTLKIVQTIEATRDIMSQIDWNFVSNTQGNEVIESFYGSGGRRTYLTADFPETKPISTYIFAFAAGPFEQFNINSYRRSKAELTEIGNLRNKGIVVDPVIFSELLSKDPADRTNIYVRKSQAAKFRPHASEVIRLNREGIKFLQIYFDYKFPWPKYDLVLIPEFPFGGMEHAGATFLRESSIIFPTEPTKGDHITRANLIFHEAAHQWFGDTVTMRWFDDLWLKEGFAEFMAYKTLEKVMPEANAWKVFYERNKQAAYLTDSTRGTTPIYQKIDNLSAAKSAYGNIVYRKAPSFLRQAEFYLGEDKFQTAARAFLKKHEFANAGWEELVKEFENATNTGLHEWANKWITQSGLPIFRSKQWKIGDKVTLDINVQDSQQSGRTWSLKTNSLMRDVSDWRREETSEIRFKSSDKVMFGWGRELIENHGNTQFQFLFPNYQDYGYGIFLLDDKSRDYVLKNIQNEKDPFLRSMMYGALWDSVREAELDPKIYVEMAIKQLGGSLQKPARSKGTRDTEQVLETDETIIQSLLTRVGTAMNYYLPDAQRNAIAPRFEEVLLDRLQNAPTAGQRVTFYRAYVNNASSEKGRVVLKEMLRQASGGNLSGSEGALRGQTPTGTLPTGRVSGSMPTLRTKDKFDIVTRLIVIGDPEAPKLLADLEKTETSDDAKRYAYAAKAAFATQENKAKFFNAFLMDKTISESWIEGATGPFNNIRHADLTQQYLERALAELPNLKRTRKIFFINNWLAAFIGGQRDEKALAIVNKFLADNPNLDNDLRLKILENVDLIERAVKIRAKW